MAVGTAEWNQPRSARVKMGRNSLEIGCWFIVMFTKCCIHKELLDLQRAGAESRGMLPGIRSFGLVLFWFFFVVTGMCREGTRMRNREWHILLGSAITGRELNRCSNCCRRRQPDADRWSFGSVLDFAADCRCWWDEDWKLGCCEYNDGGPLTYDCWGEGGLMHWGQQVEFSLSGWVVEMGGVTNCGVRVRMGRWL